jgi:hypothetical protein
MSTITIYMSDREVRAIKRAARKENLSVSGWARNKIKREITSEWPKGYFDLLGSLDDESMTRPPQPSKTSDAARKHL